MTGKLVVVGFQFGSGDMILLSLSVHICLGLQMEYWLTVGTYAHHSHSILCQLCYLNSLNFAATHPTFTPSHLPTIYASPILMYSLKKSSKLV